MEASIRDRPRPAQGLARKVLLPPLLAGVAMLCLLVTVAISFNKGAKASNPLAGAASTPDLLAKQLTADLEGTPTPADIARAQKPVSERRRILHSHPYFSLYKIAKRRFGVSWYLVAAVHYQETGFGEAPQTLAATTHWKRHKNASGGILRPSGYPNRTQRHPSVKDDFDVVMAIAADLKAGGAKSLGEDAHRATGARYGPGPNGRLATAMVMERARAWKLLGTLPLLGSGELATPVKGVVGGCGYFGCPRPGHIHNGVDFLAPTGTPIHAADAGEVASVESPSQSGGYGNFICIQHRPRLATCYAHMSAFAAAVRPGARVRRGQVIGLVGSTGSSSAPHLHFEVRRGPAACSTCAVDPLPMLSGDVPETALPKMVDAAPSLTRASKSAPVLPTAPAPVPTVPADEEDAREQDSSPARGCNHGGAPATGGAVPGTAAPSHTTPAPASSQPTPSAPAAPTAPAPAPTPPAAEPGTGGAVPTTTPPPAPPPPPDPPAAAQPHRSNHAAPAGPRGARPSFASIVRS